MKQPLAEVTDSGPGWKGPLTVFGAFLFNTVITYSALWQFDDLGYYKSLLYVLYSPPPFFRYKLHTLCSLTRMLFI